MEPEHSRNPSDSLPPGISPSRGNGWMLVIRDIARATDRRTSIAAIVPVTAIGDTAHILRVGATPRRTTGRTPRAHRPPSADSTQQSFWWTGDEP